jgi:restriction endonuclease Mrr
VIPDCHTLMRPTLAYLADGRSKRARAVKETMAAELGLPQEEYFHRLAEQLKP